VNPTLSLLTQLGSPRPFICTDSFNRANSSTLGSTDGVLGAHGVSKAWTEHAGNWEINSNRIGSQGSSPGGQGWLVTVDLGFSDYVLEWQLAYTTDGTGNAVLLAFVDGTNFIRASHTSSTIQFQRTTSGSTSAIGSGGASATPLAGDTVVITKIGSAYTYRLIRAGAQVGASYTATDTQGQSSTVVGLRAGAASVRWTNFVARRAV
jgi:hypothetical protein